MNDSLVIIHTHEVYFSGFEIKTSFYYMRCIEKLEIEIDISLTRHDFFSFSIRYVQDAYIAVSYTHLTLPTILLV